jgi:hypothetical protein
MAGSMTAGTAGAAGQSTAGASGNDGGTGGMADSTDAGIAGATGSGGSADAGAADTTGTAGATGNGLGFGGGDITRVVPTPGCGMAPVGFTPGTLVGPMHIMTMGTKFPSCADSKCGAWTDTRDYWVRLPTGYDMTKAYPLVFEGPGCGGKGNNLYAVPDLASTVIRVGLSPSVEAQAFHAVQPNQGCFDDHEGDDSVDWAFYENLYDRLAVQLCFDRNRVFVAGNEHGAKLMDELACRYAGDAARPVRGVLSNGGGLTIPKYLPTCTTKPMAGIWVDETNNPIGPFANTKLAIARAMEVNGCTFGTGYDDAAFDNFPIGGGNPDTICQKIRGCPDLTPLVVCALPGNSAYSSNSSVVNPGWSTFIKLFTTPPLLTP